MMKGEFYFVLIIIILLVNSALAIDYYVDPAGTDDASIGSRCLEKY